ncbi:MAG: UDP-N-acetyl-D-mannosamine dehydrogenase [Nitrospirae bacterium]|nr:MAG: UDP-N-acetyl-D-mannosamine dehydrogenase [Nitrospirota bacterium]
MSRVCVIGLGHIGLPTASVLATAGAQVIGVDVNPRVVEVINSGNIHIQEQDLDVLVRAAVLSGQLRATCKVEEADAFLIAVPTPFRENYAPDLTAVQHAVNAVLQVVKKGNLIILESTCPVGTTEDLVAAPLEERGYKVGTDVFVAYCPERVLPGQVLKELVDNDRVIGGMTPTCALRATELYGKFVRGQCHVTRCRTAEMVKLAENAYRDANIAFANEMSMVCSEMGIDVWELIGLANRHPRVNILRPGPGVGGHCIAVDPWFIVSQAPSTAQLIRKAREVNMEKAHWTVERIMKAAKALDRPTIAILGVAYKADVDDVRESPALEVAKELQVCQAGRVVLVDPHVPEIHGFEMRSLAEGIAEADIVAVMVPHRAFRPLPSLDGKKLLDFCGLTSEVQDA